MIQVSSKLDGMAYFFAPLLLEPLHGRQSACGGELGNPAAQTIDQ
jgi:hypothetical protein